jgi:hypothetical protein
MIDRLWGLILQDNGAWACKCRDFGMRPKERAQTPQSDLFRLKLTNLIDLRHELCRRGERINWQALVDEFGALYFRARSPGSADSLDGGSSLLEACVWVVR